VYVIYWKLASSLQIGCEGVISSLVDFEANGGKLIVVALEVEPRVGVVEL
jgi:hypothetical protein